MVKAAAVGTQVSVVGQMAEVPNQHGAGILEAVVRRCGPRVLACMAECLLRGTSFAARVGVYARARCSVLCCMRRISWSTQDGVKIRVTFPDGVKLAQYVLFGKFQASLHRIASARCFV